MEMAFTLEILREKGLKLTKNIELLGKNIELLGKEFERIRIAYNAKNYEEFNKVLNNLKNRITSSQTLPMANKQNLLNELNIIDKSFSKIPEIATSIDDATIIINKVTQNVENIAPTTGVGGRSLFIVKETGEGLQVGPRTVRLGGRGMWYGKTGGQLERISAESIDGLVSILKSKGVNIARDINNPNNIIIYAKKGPIIYEVDLPSYIGGSEVTPLTLIEIGPYK